MRPHALAAALLCLNIAPVDAQIAAGMPAPDSSRSEIESARLHPLEFDNPAVRILAPYNDTRELDPEHDLSSARGWAPGTLSTGPLSMDIGSSDRGPDGKQTHVAHIHLDEFHVFGGDVSGTFDGRAATLRLSWPTEN